MEHASLEPRDISFHLLEEITNGFSDERKVGSGAYGKVYKGVHKNGENIAVKVLYDMALHEDNEERYEKEFNNLVRLQHRNIVRLVGYCNEIQKKYVEYHGRYIFAERMRRALCFEFMVNGSLDNHLFEESNGHDWPTRYTIIKGICKGLKYLHEDLESPIYHLDLKPGNVLMDANMVPKLADFGLSRLFGEEQTQITNSSIGTRGYIPPEYIEAGIISIKFDIFSLGVVIIKIMTGHQGYFRSAEMSSEEFTVMVHENWRKRIHTTSLDVMESYCKQVKRCIEIALSCVEFDRHKRPTIGYIVHELNKIENASQIPNALRNDPGSSMNQESRQTYLTEVEEIRVREKLSTIDNIFGEIVDNHKLDKMARYMGKPKIRKDRAREALTLVNEDDKDSKANIYLYDLHSNCGPVQGSTQCLIYNATGDTLYQVDSHDWDGQNCAIPYPTEIGNGQWAAFRHTYAFGSTGSVAAVVYRGKNKDSEDHDYILAWRAPSAIYQRNKSYCEIGGADNFQEHCHSLPNKLLNSDYSSNAKSNGCEIEAKISKGICPRFTAIISYR